MTEPTYSGQALDSVGDAWREACEDLEAAHHLLARHERAWSILRAYSPFAHWLAQQEQQTLREVFRKVVPGWTR